MATQNIDLLCLSVVLANDMPAGSIVDFNGRQITSYNQPFFGITTQDGKKDERIKVVCKGTANVLAYANVEKGRWVISSFGKARQTNSYNEPHIGVALQDAKANQLFEVLLK